MTASTKYPTIVVDPPWELKTKRMNSGGRRSRSTEVPYEFMSLPDIMRVPVGSYAEDDCLLFLWATRKVFRDGIAAAVAVAWGFEPFAESIWGLRNPGMGKNAVGNDHEPILIARRGKATMSDDEVRMIGVHFWRQTYSGGGKVHSAKPEAFLDVVEQVAPGPYLEMFSRRARMGWDTWGNEALHGGVADAG